MLTVKDVAWAAGFMEGEGSFVLAGRNKVSPVVSVAQVQREPLERMQRMFGGNISLQRRSLKRPTNQDIHQMAWTGRRAAEIIMTLYVLMSPRRQEQMRKVLDVWKAVPLSRQYANKTHCGRGHERTAENTYVAPKNTTPQCRVCIKLRTKEWAAKRRLKAIQSASTNSFLGA